MIVSHNDTRLNEPVTVGYKRTDYYAVDIQINFKSTVLNDASYYINSYEYSMIELTTTDKEAIIFAAELKEYLNGDTPKCLIDGDEHDFNIIIDKDGLTLSVEYTANDALIGVDPEDGESHIEVL